MRSDAAGAALLDADLIGAMQIELSDCFAHDQARLTGLLQNKPESSVFTGSFRGQAVVYKKFKTGNAADVVAKSCAELKYLQANLPSPFFANRCLGTAPERGWIVLSKVPGVTVESAIAQSGRAERCRIMSLAGGWLNACCQLRSETRAVHPQRFVRKVLAMDCSGLVGKDLETSRELTEHVRRLSRRVRETRTIYTVAHGDFTARNLHYADRTVHAVDIQGGYWFPAVRIAARFLVARDFYRDLPTDPLWYGLNAEDSAGFLAAAGGASGEQDPVLQFFILEQFTARFIGNYARASLQPGVYKRIESLMSALHNRKIS